MKKPLLLIFSILINASLFAQIPNSSFENWTGNDPDGYLTSNMVYSAIDAINGTVHPASVTKVGTAFDGSFAVKVSNTVGTLNSVVTDTLIGFIITDNISSSADVGFPVNSKPTSLSGYFKFNQGGAAPTLDTGQIIVTLSKFNTTTNQRDSLGGGTKLFFTTVNNFTLFTIPIGYKNATLPDTATISIYSSVTVKSYPNTSITVDALSFGVGAAAVKFPLADNPPVNFPNPANDVVNIRNLPATGVSLEIKDLSGRAVKSLTVDSNEVKVITSDLQPGIYIYNVLSPEGDVVFAEKMVVQH